VDTAGNLAVLSIVVMLMIVIMMASKN